MDFADLVILVRNYGKQVSATPAATSALMPSFGTIDLLTRKARRQNLKIKT